MKQEIQNTADMLVSILSESGAWIHMDAETNRPVVYVNDGEKRYCVKKVQVLNSETRKLTSEWVNLGEVASKKAATPQLDPAIVQATKELIAEGKLPAAK